MPDEAFDRDTGEILSTRAADGTRRPPPSATLADTIRLLNDGQFDLDASAEMRELIRKISDHAENAKGVAKGSMTIKLDVKMMNGAHVVTPHIKITALETLQREHSAAFATEIAGLRGRLGKLVGAAA